jgi:hypothetical protein
VRTIRKLSFILLAALGCTGRGGPAADSTGTGIASRTLAVEPSAVIGAERGVVLGLRIGMPLDSVKRLLGEPLRTGTEFTDSVARTALEFPIGTVRIAGTNGVVDFLCGGDDCRTQDGVGIGDSLDVILGTYGPTPPRGPAESPEALDYRLGITDCNLTFTLASGRVTSLELGCAVR